MRPLQPRAKRVAMRVAPCRKRRYCFADPDHPPPMPSFRTMTTRKALIVLHDLLMTAAALVAAFYIRFEEQRLSVRLDLLWLMVPPVVIYAGIVYHFFHLDDAKWRFA